MNDAEQRAEDIRALGLVLAEWGKAVGDYAAAVAVRHGPPSAHDSDMQVAAQRRMDGLRRQQALAALEETSKRLAIVLSRHWHPSGDDL